MSKSQFIALVGFALLCVASHETYAQSEQDPLACRNSRESSPSVGVYTFFLDSEKIFCVAPSDDADDTDVPCLRIGRVHVGQSRASVEELLGAPFQQFPERIPGLSTNAYWVLRDSIAGTGTYYVVEYEKLEDKEIAFSVQLTGDRPDLLHHFSCLHLEDEEELLRTQLGAASDVSPFQFAGDNVSGVVWSYAPLPLSIELVDGKVYSFRVWRPDFVAPKVRQLSVLVNR